MCSSVLEETVEASWAYVTSLYLSSKNFNDRKRQTLKSSLPRCTLFHEHLSSPSPYRCGLKPHDYGKESLKKLHLLIILKTQVKGNSTRWLWSWLCFGAASCLVIYWGTTALMMQDSKDRYEWGTARNANRKYTFPCQMWHRKGCP